MITSIYTFPLEPIGKALREMSLTSTEDNITAILFFALFGLTPIILWLFLKKKKSLVKADYLLFPLSGVFFYTLYYSINPGLFKTSLSGAQGIYLSGLFYSALIAYGVIRIQSMASGGSRKTLQRLLKFFLGLLAVIFAIIALLELTITMPQAMEDAGKAYEELYALASFAGVEVEANLGAMEAVAFVDVMMKIIPYVLDIIIIGFAFRLVKALEKDWYSEESVKAAGRLSVIAGRTLVIIPVIQLFYNLLQILFRNSLLKTSLVLDLPVISIIFLLAVLLLSKYIKASQELKNENDLFV